MRVWSAGSCGKRADSLPPRPGHGVLPVNTGGCPPDEARCRMPRPDSVLLLTFLRKPTGSQTIDFPSRLRDLRVRLYRYHTPKTHAKPRRTRSSGATDSSLQRRTSHIAHYRCQNVRSTGTRPRLTRTVDRGGNHPGGWGPGRGSPRAERALLPRWEQGQCVALISCIPPALNTQIFRQFGLSLPHGRLGFSLLSRTPRHPPCNHAFYGGYVNVNTT